MNAVQFEGQTEHGPAHVPTFASFIEQYRHSKLGRLRAAVAQRNWYRVAFELRIRTGNEVGEFGLGAHGARWCWPWQWARRYYLIRFGEQHV